VEDLVEMLEKVPKIQDSPTAIDFNFVSGKVQFKNVSFGHLSEKKNSKDAD
jgi:hypothetical protein